MPRRCSVCDHPEVDAINAALLGTDSIRDIASRFAISRSALDRHKAGHLPAHLAKASQAAETVQADSLLTRLRALNHEVAEVLRAAKTEHDHELRLKAIARAERQIELEARLLGELEAQTVVNVVTSPDWLAIRSVVLAVLAPYPEAAIEAAGRLSRLEAGA